jgi:peptidoglycan hydrolase FlgJ
MDISKDIQLLRIQQSRIAPKLPKGATADKVGGKKSFNKELRKAADGFEELFVHKMLQIMRSTVKKNGFMSGGRGEEIFQDMLDENYAKIITQSRAFGLSELIYNQNKK